MSKPKLTYFDLPGRGEVSRLAFTIAGIDFEDHRVPRTEWGALKPTTPWGGMPILEIDGKVLAQSNAVNRYVGRLTGLYPVEDAWAAAKCDEIMDAVEDVANHLVSTFSLPDAEKVARRTELLAGPIGHILAGYERNLKANGGEFFAGNKLSVGDLKVYGSLRWLSSGALDGIPTTFIAEKYPTLSAFKARLDAHPKIAEWNAAHAPRK